MAMAGHTECEPIQTGKNAHTLGFVVVDDDDVVVVVVVDVDVVVGYGYCGVGVGIFVFFLCVLGVVVVD